MLSKRNGYNWHQELVHFPDVMFNDMSEHKKHKDFCKYLRWFLWKSLVVIPITVILAGSFLGWYLAGLAFFLTTFTVSQGISGVGYDIWLSANAGIFALVVFVSTMMYFDDRKEKRLAIESADDYVAPPQGFLSLWWDKVHKRICPPLEY